MGNRAATGRRTEIRDTSDLVHSVGEFADRPELAPASRRFYRDSLVLQFLPWAAAEGLHEPRELTPDVIARYARDLEERRKADGSPLRVTTRQTYLRAIRQYLGWLRRRRKVVEVDERELVLPSTRRQHRDVLPPADIRRLEDAAEEERDKLIIRVMADAGPRIGEVANLTTGDLIERDQRMFFLRFRGKTGERYTPIEPALYRRLRDYAKRTQRQRSDSAALFIGSRRANGSVAELPRASRHEVGGYAALTEDGIYRIVHDTAARARLGRRVHPHLFRHTRITNWVASGLNIVTVSEIAGVSVAVIARHYVHQTDEQRWDAVMKALAT